MSLLAITSGVKKLFIQLHQKKYRQKRGYFLVAGQRSVQELHQSAYQVEAVCVSAKQEALAAPWQQKGVRCYEVPDGMLAQISPLDHHDDVVALVKMAAASALPKVMPKRYLILDHIQQPSNLGALLRLADWYGMTDIVASLDTVDGYNPKVIQASMGSFVRVRLHYRALLPFVKDHEGVLLGATLQGENAHTFAFPSSAGLVIGNEGKGIRNALYPYLTHQVTIPKYGGAESLNLAVAAGILCDRWWHP